MTDLMDRFKGLQEKTVPELHIRMSEIKGSSAPEELSDEKLQELVCIMRVLRSKSSVGAPARVKRAPPSLEDL